MTSSEEKVPPEYVVEEDHAPHALAGLFWMALGIAEGIATGWWIWG